MEKLMSWPRRVHCVFTAFSWRLFSWQFHGDFFHGIFTAFYRCENAMKNYFTAISRPDRVSHRFHGKDFHSVKKQRKQLFFPRSSHVNHPSPDLRSVHWNRAHTVDNAHIHHHTQSTPLKNNEVIQRQDVNSYT